MENQQIQTEKVNQLQVVNPPKQSLTICRGGNDLFEIETICELPKVQFFDAVYSIEKIKDRKYQAGFKTLVGSILTKISVLCGIKGEIDQFTKQDLIKMLITTYCEISIEEIYKAFELERYGVYETRTEHFQQFNAEYISEVLKKYRVWKIKEKQLLNYNPPKEDTGITEEEKLKIRNEFLETVFLEMKSNKKNFSSVAWLLSEDLKDKITTSAEVRKRLQRLKTKEYQKELELNARLNKSNIKHKNVLDDFKKMISKKEESGVVINRRRAVEICHYLRKYLKDFETFKKAIQ